MRRLFFLPVFLVAIGCDEADSTSVRLVIQADLSGTVTTSSLAETDRGAIEPESQGVRWTARAQVVALQGRFEDLSKTPLRIGDLTFEVSNNGRGFRLRVTLPAGPDAKWPTLIAPSEPSRRAAIRAAMDPDGETEGLGEEIKIQIDLPAEAVASGYRPDLAPVRDSVDKKRVTLIVKVDKIRAGGRTVEWDVTW